MGRTRRPHHPTGPTQVLDRRFRDRRDAGERLARLLMHLRAEDPVVVGLPRGGVPVAATVAEALGAPLDVIVVRKLGVPFRPEVGMGAVGEDGALVVDETTVRLADVSPGELAEVVHRERRTVEQHVARFRGHRRAVPLTGRTVVVVDDGVATGGTARVALQVARARGARRVVLAVPVAPVGTLRELGAVADEVVCVWSPGGFAAVGQWYADFAPVPDATVEQILTEAGRSTGGRGDGVGVSSCPVEVVTAGVVLPGILTVPTTAGGVVVFAHGSGSSRHSPRNRFVADVLGRTGLATLLLDLSTPDEERDGVAAFDVGLLADRLVGVVGWLGGRPETAELPVGLFGASTGGAVALAAAAQLGDTIAAVVTRGGRADLAGPWLGRVRSPTLLVVGEHDEFVLAGNRAAARHLAGPVRLAVVPGAAHLFEEPGTLAAAAELATDWLTEHLVPHVPEVSTDGNAGATRAGLDR